MERVPALAPPNGVLVDRKGHRGGIDGEHPLRGEVAASVVQNPLITKKQPPLLAAIWAEGWWGYL